MKSTPIERTEMKSMFEEPGQVVGYHNKEMRKIQQLSWKLECFDVINTQIMRVWIYINHL